MLRVKCYFLYGNLFFLHQFDAVNWVVIARLLEGGTVPGKINFGENFVRNLGQYFYQGFKPQDRIFPAGLKESSISFSHPL